VVDAATVLATHLTEVLKSNMAELLSYGEVQKLLKELPKEQSELVKDLVPTQIAVSGIQRVLQNLLTERISIRDLATILEGIAEGIGFSRNPAVLAEHVRTRLGRQICAHDVARHPAVRSLHRRTLPRADGCFVAVRDSSARAPQDDRQHLVQGWFRFESSCPRLSRRGWPGQCPAMTDVFQSWTKHALVTGRCDAFSRSHTYLWRESRLNRLCPARDHLWRGDRVMTHSLIHADRATHLKIVALALIAGIVIVIGGIHAHLGRPDVTAAGPSDGPVLKAGQPATLTKRDIHTVR
jgi:hypothetical protein